MPYVGEIRLFAGNFPPKGWALCNGQQLSIRSFPDLFEVIGTSFGGDNVDTFALPDLRGRVPVHVNNSVALGQTGGSELVVLNPDQLPKHDHQVFATRAAPVASSPIGYVFTTGADASGTRVTSGTKRSMARTSRAGAGFGHDNVQPFICLNYIVAIEGQVVAGSGASA